MKALRLLVLAMALVLVVGACSDDDSGSTTQAPASTAAPATTQASATTEAPDEHMGAGFEVDAAAAAITVDGDVSDWDGVAGLDLTLEGIEGEDVESHDVTVQFAHDDANLYMLFAVGDDYNWTADDAHLSASAAVMWAVDPEAGPHMGSDAEGKQDDYESLGMVDIWHWELECAAGAEAGGAVSGATDGNDPACNFDDEYATDPETREDDDTAQAENSLTGVWNHSNPVADGDGTWYFEMSRPLQTGDPQDAQFAVGDTALLALAYWDADNSDTGWDDDEHIQSSSQGWITVNVVGDTPAAAAGDEAGFDLEAPAAAITVDLSIDDWADVPALDLTLEGIEGENVESHDVTVQVAHDDTDLYMLLAVQDDYNWTADDAHLSGANAVLWAIDPEAGPHMGSDAEGKQEDYESLGMVDIWHWELECDFGVTSGGLWNAATDGNDPACNFDDEYATDPETREDDDTAAAENTLTGIWMHTNPVADGDGTWYFEMSRPLQTGDPQDAQFAVGHTALLALAYWDADNSDTGWDDDEHIQSSSQGWISVTLVG